MNRKKIILIYPPGPLSSVDKRKEKGNFNPPLGILSIGTVLSKEGFDVRCLDLEFDFDFVSKASEAIKDEEILFVGVSAMTSQLGPALRILETVKKSRPELKTVLGGVHPSLFPEQTVSDSRVDIVVRDEGEYASLDLARRLSGSDDLEGINGVTYKRGSKVISNPNRDFLDINDLPLYDFDLLDVERYLFKDMTHVGGKTLAGGPKRRSLPVLSGLGCLYKCAFCINTVLKKKRRYKSADKIISEIEYLISRYGINDVPIIDEDFFENKKRAERFLDLVREKKLDFSWHTNVRANYFNDNYLSDPFLKRLRKNGCFHLGCGAESGSEAILSVIDKGIKPDHVLRASRSCRKAGINIVFSFITAIPGETRGDLDKTIALSSKLMSVNHDNSYLAAQVFRPYPGSKLFDESVKLGLAVPDTLEGWAKKWGRSEGYFNLEELPWVTDRRHIRLATFYMNYASDCRNAVNIREKLAIRILAFLSRLRLRFNFFALPFEYYILKRKGFVT